MNKHICLTASMNEQPTIDYSVLERSVSGIQLSTVTSIQTMKGLQTHKQPQLIPASITAIQLSSKSMKL
jgi:hypothetical protein